MSTFDYLRIGSKCSCGYSLWTHKGGTIGAFVGFEKLSEIPDVSFYTQHHVGESFVEHRPLGVVSVFAETIGEFSEKIDKINRTISIIDEEGNDVFIRYTDFDYLKGTYEGGQKE